MVPVDKTTEILDALVGFDTTSRNSNLALVAWIEDYLDRLGVAHERISDATGEKANLWATIGPAGRARLHPVRPYRRGAGRRPDLDERSVPPHRARRPPVRPRRDRHEGLRGLLPRGRAGHGRRRPLPRPIHLAFSYDEEVGCVGVRGLIAESRRLAGQAGRLLRRRADRDGRGGRPQGQALVPGRRCAGAPAIPRSRRRASTRWNMRRALIVEDPRDRPTAWRARRARSALRRAVYDHPYRRGRRAAPRSTSCPTTATFEFEFRADRRRRSDALAGEVMAYARERLEPEMQARRAGGGHRPSTDRRDFPGSTRRPTLDVVALAKTLAGTQRPQQGRLRHRGRAVRRRPASRPW